MSFDIEVGSSLNKIKNLGILVVIGIIAYGILRFSLLGFLTGRIYEVIEAKKYDYDLEMSIKYIFILPTATLVLYSATIWNIKKSIIVISLYLGCCHLCAYVIRNGLPVMPAIPIITTIPAVRPSVSPPIIVPPRQRPSSQRSERIQTQSDCDYNKLNIPKGATAICRDGVWHYKF